MSEPKGILRVIVNYKDTGYTLYQNSLTAQMYVCFSNQPHVLMKVDMLPIKEQNELFLMIKSPEPPILVDKNQHW